ncbi:MAG: winged helix-turn-helix transcriptional regulator [Saprospiraceae bacterium]|nr:winged helix-turn-helix transcriptional regulator [Saprospiraceae bacterium]
MTKRNNRNVCIRVCRNEAQIHRCRERMGELGPPITTLSGSLSLAGNEVRMKILLLLAEEHSLCVCDLSEILGMTLPAVSQHLKKLRDGGLVFTEQDGVTIYYHISATAKPLLDTLFQLLGSRSGQDRSIGRVAMS